jgi:hypothetical protein
MSRYIEGLRSWVDHNIVGDRGSGYVDDYKAGTNLEHGLPEIPDLPSLPSPDSSAGQIIKGFLLDILTSIPIGVAISVLNHIVRSDDVPKTSTKSK